VTDESIGLKRSEQFRVLQHYPVSEKQVIAKRGETILWQVPPETAWFWKSSRPASAAKSRRQAEAPKGRQTMRFGVAAHSLLMAATLAGAVGRDRDAGIAAGRRQRADPKAGDRGQRVGRGTWRDDGRSRDAFHLLPVSRSNASSPCRKKRAARGSS